MRSIVRSLWRVLRHTFDRRVTVQYPDQKPVLAPRWRGRIILSRDPDGGERCVGCYLCAVACPVDCIALQATEDEDGRGEHDQPRALLNMPDQFAVQIQRFHASGPLRSASIP